MALKNERNTGFIQGNDICDISISLKQLTETFKTFTPQFLKSVKLFEMNKIMFSHLLNKMTKDS